MKNALIFSALTVFAFIGCSHKSKQADYTKKYKNERIETLENGLKVYFIEDASLPKVSMQLLLPVGVISEPADKAGLNSFTANLLDQGTTSKKALEIADLMADSGAEFEGQAGADFTLLSTSFLVTEFKPVLSLTTEILLNPSFPQEEIERHRQKSSVYLKSRQDRSGTWANVLIQREYYQNHPYGRDPIGTEDSIKKITRQDIVDFYKKNYVPNSARLAVTGRLTPEIEAEVKAQFSKWKKADNFVQDLVPFQAPQKGHIAKLPSPHKAQTEIRFVQPGIDRANPDFLKLRLANEILGGSFASRLNQRVRDDLGLTYSISSYTDAKKVTGVWGVSTFSKNESAQKAVDETFAVLRKYADQGITQEELNAAKNLVKAQLPRALETPSQLAYNLIALDYYGVGVDYLIQFNQKIDSYSLGEINDVIKKYMKPDDMQVLIYGQP